MGRQLGFLGGGTYTINEKTSFNAQVSYDEWKNLGVAANIAYDVVPGFTVTAEVDYLNAGKFDDANFSNFTNADKKSSIGGLLRFQRSFYQAEPGSKSNPAGNRRVFWSVAPFSDLAGVDHLLNGCPDCRKGDAVCS